MTDAQKTSTHILGLDVIRFTSALLVIGYHFGLMFWKPNTPAQLITHLPQFPNNGPPSVWFGFVGVQVFFVISGFVISYSSERATGFMFMRDRILRLGPALWICASVSLAIYLGFALKDVRSALLLYVREITIFPFPAWLDPVVWTLAIEVAFYAFVLVLICTQRLARIGTLAAYLACASLVFNCYLLAMQDLDTKPAAFAFLLKHFWLPHLLLMGHGCFFAVGILLWLWLVKERPLAQLWWGPIALAACAVQIVTTVNFEHQRGADVGYYGDLSSTLAIGVWLACVLAIVGAVRLNDEFAKRLGHRVTKEIRLVGLSTYPLYLVHWTTAGLFVRALRHFGMGVSWAIFGGFCGVVALSLAIAGLLEPPIRGRLRSLLNMLGNAASVHVRPLSFLFRSPAFLSEHPGSLLVASGDPDHSAQGSRAASETQA